MNGDAWEGIKSTFVKAANGDQKALENVAGIISGILIPAKALPTGGKTGSMAEQAASKGTGSLVEAEKAALERIGKNSEKAIDLNKPNYSILDKQAAKSDVVVELGKLDYIFGKVASDPHNAARSIQMEQSMYRLGIPIDETGAKYLMDHLSQVPKTAGNIVNVYSNQWGKFEVRESLLFGPSGKATKLQSAFQIMPDGSRRFVTTIPKDGKK